MSFADPAHIAAWIRTEAETWMRGPDNDLHLQGWREPAFDLPHIGFASAADPIWLTFKDAVGEFHWTPAEAFALAFPGASVPADELSVVSWILPQTRLTREEQRKQKEMTGERWARARIMGEEYVNNGLRKFLVTALAGRGVQAVAPFLLPEWGGRQSERFVFSSTWSERHIAHAAGLGTFGLCDGLITPVGKAMRTGSLVVRAVLPPTLRAYRHHQEYCLFYNSGSCGACIKRCPAGALSFAGHDKRLCSDFLYKTTAAYVRETWNFDGYGCGLCQVGVPCESRIPARVRVEGGPDGGTGAEDGGVREGGAKCSDNAGNKAGGSAGERA